MASPTGARTGDPCWKARNEAGIVFCCVEIKGVACTSLAVTGQVGVLDGQMVNRGWAGGQVVGVT